MRGENHRIRHVMGMIFFRPYPYPHLQMFRRYPWIYLYPQTPILCKPTCSCWIFKKHNRRTETRMWPHFWHSVCHIKNQLDNPNVCFFSINSPLVSIMKHVS